jgi:hypothetical protein
MYGFRRAGFGALSAITLAFALGSSVLTAPAFAADTATAVFNTPGAYTFTVPAGVTSVTITAIGAGGGSTPRIDSSFACGPAGAAGGHGASVTGTFTVAGGQQLLVGVGAPGASVSSCATPSQPGAGGYGGGGVGAAGESSDAGGGAGGGGASEVAVAAPSPAFDAPLIVAAGGGGAGGLEGSGGGPTVNGGAGAAAGAAAPANWDAAGGGAGTSSGGGIGGSSAAQCSGDGANGAPGASGVGGAGAESGGGGGGGGYYGGGGGEGDCEEGGAGGGGGSSFVASGTLGAVPVASPAGVVITYDVPAVSLTGGGVTGTGPYAFAFSTPQPEDTVGAAEVFTLTNAGSAPLAVSSVALSGNNPSDYIVRNGCGQAVAVSSACEITVRFAPQATGASSATLTISSNAINGSEVISLSGTGGQLPQGLPGARGAPGKVELVTCKAVTKRIHHKKVTRQHCTTKLTSSPKKFTTRTARAALMGAGRVYATGWLRDGKLVLHTNRALHPGRFRLKITYRSAGRIHIESETITIR